MWACNKLDQKGVDHVIDSRLDSCFKEEICKVLNIGFMCTSPLPINRPAMRRVVKMLQEVGSQNQTKPAKKDGKLSPYYYDDGSDQGMLRYALGTARGVELMRALSPLLLGTRKRTIRNIAIPTSALHFLFPNFIRAEKQNISYLADAALCSWKSEPYSYVYGGKSLGFANSRFQCSSLLNSINSIDS
ncbi:hypothetical protein VNO78_03846 [Psophocarpus tetragonolobus]|uniref:Uncharacterized protein n=1 Tax=Psophocarpus tetragonolobus TaxID=3891 RepID=A0AAN9T2X3_PSOTE